VLRKIAWSRCTIHSIVVTPSGPLAHCPFRIFLSKLPRPGQIVAGPEDFSPWRGGLGSGVFGATSIRSTARTEHSGVADRAALVVAASAAMELRRGGDGRGGGGPEESLTAGGGTSAWSLLDSESEGTGRGLRAGHLTRLEIVPAHGCSPVPYFFLSSPDSSAAY
jgi:hypothetical protein